jgi:hypothetical protein
MCSRLLGDSDSITLRNLRNLIVVKRQLGQNIEALQMLRKSIRLHKQVYGDNHPDTIWVLGELASLENGLFGDGRLNTVLHFGELVEGEDDDLSAIL